MNDILAVDQHDKWLYKFGLALHVGIDPFIGRICWIKIWWTNKNPRLICSYYIEWIHENGGCTLQLLASKSQTNHYNKSKLLDTVLITQSDPGSENYGIAKAHSYLRQWGDPELQGTIQHRWMRQKKNVKPEIAWSQFRRRFAPGFEDLMDEGVREGWYHPDVVLEFCAHL